MSSSTSSGGRLAGLRTVYRATFREWISARRLLDGIRVHGIRVDGVRVDKGDRSEAELKEVAAAMAYRNARNSLDDARVENRSPPERQRGRVNHREEPVTREYETQPDGSLRDFMVALLLIVITVAAGKLLADWYTRAGLGN